MNWFGAVFSRITSRVFFVGKTRRLLEANVLKRRMEEVEFVAAVIHVSQLFKRPRMMGVIRNLVEDSTGVGVVRSYGATIQAVVPQIF